MRTAGLTIIASLALSCCQKRPPDFALSVNSPDRSRTAVLEAYQPHGTIDGWINLSFPGPGSERAATFFRMKNADFGWVSSDTLAVVADHLEYGAIGSHYFPDGTTRTETRLLICVREELDCSKLEAQMGENRRRIAGFPKGLYDGPSAPTNRT
jgi:hypothetical protein